MRCSALLLAVSISAPAAFAQTAASVCGSLLTGFDQTRCLGVINGHQVAPGAAEVCKGTLTGHDAINCLSAALDKQYSPEELETCNRSLTGFDRINCMKAAGRLPPPPTQVVVDRRDDSDRSRDDDSRRSRRGRGSWRDRDEDNRDRARSLRLTNYSGRTLTRLYWRLSGERRYRDLRIRAQVQPNEYYDFEVPDEVTQVCVESRDGFRMYWNAVDPAVHTGVTVEAYSPNWAKGRCEGL